MLVPAIGESVSEDNVKTIQDYLGVMNTRLEGKETPGVMYNGSLTNEQKENVEKYFRSHSDKTVAILFIENNNDDNFKSFNGTVYVEEEEMSAFSM